MHVIATWVYALSIVIKHEKLGAHVKNLSVLYCILLYFFSSILRLKLIIFLKNMFLSY